MTKFEMVDYVDGAREMIFVAMEEHGILCADGHWLTEEELYAMFDADVLALYDRVYGKD